MNSIFSINTAATDLKLLTLEEMRQSINISNSSKDDILIRLERQMSDRVARFCKIRSGGVVPPTFRQETVVETFRLGSGAMFDYNENRWETSSRASLMMSRGPITSVVSVVEDDITLDSINYEIHPNMKMLTRLDDDDNVIHWAPSKIVVTYVCGWAVVPESLKLAVGELLKDSYLESGRDLGVKEIEIPGVIRRVYNVGNNQSAESDIPQYVVDMLGPFINTVIR